MATVPMDAINLGHVQFVRQQDGCLAVAQGWKPSRISLDEREESAKALREIADAMDRDEFEVNEKYRYFKPTE